MPLSSSLSSPNRMGIERASGSLAKPAACVPALQVVPLNPRVEDPAAIYFPPCTRQCNYKQDYIQDECRCVCSNTDDEAKCKRFSHIKIWDSDKCECGCREIEPCSEGLYFDKNTCRCLPIKTQKQRYLLYMGSK
ncbi:Protein of unknown function [Cotesia congregata]|uniref:Uncharacterized protein n=1 Tax=Cotesia congregata TaxID=51543 RepID=A0A8J2HJT3_COTCN|nr:Protein of unknown function [Cotesia congregata]